MELKDAMSEKFGDKETEAYVKMNKATHALIRVCATYMLSDDGSAMEKAAGETMDKMLASLGGHPDKARMVIENLLALVVVLDGGGSLQDWFDELGIS